MKWRNPLQFYMIDPIKATYWSFMLGNFNFEGFIFFFSPLKGLQFYRVLGFYSINWRFMPLYRFLESNLYFML